MSRALCLCAALLLVAPSLAQAQVAVDDDKQSESSDSPSPTNDRLMDLLGGIGAPTTDPAKGTESPRPPARVKDAVSRCFQEARKRDVKVDGRVEIEITLADGRVQSGKLVEALSYELLLRECLVAAVKEAPVPDATVTEFTWLFIPSGAN